MTNPIAWIGAIAMAVLLISILSSRQPVPWPVAAFAAFIAFGLLLDGALGNPSLAQIVAFFRKGD
jgi:hypothetical protein